MRLFALFAFLWRVLLATDPAHLRPGALSTRLGTVHLVEDVLWVRYPHIPLRSVPRRLRAIASDLDSLLASLEHSVPKDTEYRRDTFALLSARASYVNESLSVALDSFADLDVPARPKRGLINGLGRISQFMFGTAMDEDVSDLKSKYAYLTNIAGSHQKVITLTALLVQQLVRKVEDMASYTHTIRDYMPTYNLCLRRVTALTHLTTVLLLYFLVFLKLLKLSLTSGFSSICLFSIFSLIASMISVGSALLAIFLLSLLTPGHPLLPVLVKLSLLP